MKRVDIGTGTPGRTLRVARDTVRNLTTSTGDRPCPTDSLTTKRDARLACPTNSLTTERDARRD
jgi:hypothetical protein